MKKMKKVIVLLVLCVFVTGAAYSENLEFDAIQGAVGGFSKSISRSVPLYSTLGLNWSDPYIGKFFPSLPPHFGVGISTGFVTFGNDEFKNMLNAVGVSSGALPGWLSNIGMPIPAYTVEARIGGFFLPFDVGAKFGILPLANLGDFGIDYLLIGADIRYGVLDKPLIPIKISVGVGYNHLRGGVTVPVGQSLDFDVLNDHTLKLERPRMGFLWGTDNIDLKAQLSLKLPLITPYAGVGMNYAFSHAGYRFKTNIKVIDSSNNEVELDQNVIDELKDKGISNISIKGFESIEKMSDFNMRLFGGISLNLPLIRFDLNLLYNLTGNQFGASLGARLQI